jgi:hypothetical protein
MGSIILASPTLLVLSVEKLCHLLLPSLSTNWCGKHTGSALTVGQALTQRSTAATLLGKKGAREVFKEDLNVHYCVVKCTIHWNI